MNTHFAFVLQKSTEVIIPKEHAKCPVSQLVKLEQPIKGKLMRRLLKELRDQAMLLRDGKWVNIERWNAPFEFFGKNCDVSLKLKKTHSNPCWKRHKISLKKAISIRSTQTSSRIHFAISRPSLDFHSPAPWQLGRPIDCKTMNEAKSRPPQVPSDMFYNQLNNEMKSRTCGSTIHPWTSLIPMTSNTKHSDVNSNWSMLKGEKATEEGWVNWKKEKERRKKELNKINNKNYF